MWKKFIFILINFLLYFTLAFSSSLGYNATCTVFPDNCYKYKGFKCEPDLKVCRCREDFPMEFNPDIGICVVKGYGSSCIDAKPWVDFICEDEFECSLFESGIRMDYAACYCRNNFFPYKNESSVNPNDTICLPGRLGMDCTNPCHAGLGSICNQGKCECPYPISQEFYDSLDSSNPLSGGCLGLPEFPNGCNFEEKGRINKCTENSFCGEDNKCHCKPGFSLDGSNNLRHCRLDYNQACEMDQQYNNAMKCSTQRGLKCINGVCSCGADAGVQYDPKQNICALAEDYPCSSNKEYGVLPCFTGLECQGNGTDPLFQKCVQADNNDEQDVGVPDVGKNCTSGKNESESGNKSVV